jgi:hypothetical protein
MKAIFQIQYYLTKICAFRDKRIKQLRVKPHSYGTHNRTWTWEFYRISVIPVMNTEHSGILN